MVYHDSVKSFGDKNIPDIVEGRISIFRSIKISMENIVRENF